MDNVTLCHSLIKWLKTFPGHANVGSTNLTDGVAMAKVLNQIAPEYFDGTWLSKIKTDVGENWRLKVSNLRKVHQGVMDYYSESVGQSVAHYAPPDLNKIGEFGDEAELGGLLQLILGCAINCEQKQRHIEAIMMMEESVQSVIVNAIQDLLNREGSPGVAEASLGPASFHPQVRNLMEQLESTSSAKEDLSRRCNEMDLQISLLSEEKINLKGENERLLERVEVLESGGDIGAQAMRYKDLKKQVDTLQDDLFKIETSRDDYRARVEGLESENSDLSTKNEELQKLADEARTLKDEVDALRDMSERVAVYEGTVETYKKKLEELSDLRRQVKILEDKNSDYMHHNMELEEEVKKSLTWRPQLDLYKKQVADLHQKLADEAKKTDRQIFENKKTKEKLDATVQEKDRVMLERDHLKETLEDLKCTVSAFQSPDSSSRPPSDLSDMDTLEIIPQEIREKLFRLQHENKVLKGRVNERSEEANPLLQSMLNDLQERHDRLSKENRQLNQTIMELENTVEESRTSRNSVGGARSSISKNSGESRRIAELERKLSEQGEKIGSMEETLKKKDGEMSAMEDRYKKYLGKAKSVIRTLDPKHNPALIPDMSVLRSQLSEKDKMIDNLERESEKSRLARDNEEKLISTAFYNFGMQMHRQMVSQRLAGLEQTPTFLQRQRNTANRRTMGNQSNNRTPSSSLDDMRYS